MRAVATPESMFAVKLHFPLASRLLVAAALFLLAAALATPALAANSAGVFGEWRTPSGSTIRIEHCGAHVCLQVAALPPDVPSTDIHNPNAALRGRALCGLVIGSGFVLTDGNHASGGTLYDPKTGKTYRGGMTMEGSRLHLRGYIGIPLFGASQTWTRVTAPVKPCGGK